METNTVQNVIINENGDLELIEVHGLTSPDIQKLRTVKFKKEVFLEYFKVYIVCSPSYDSNIVYGPIYSFYIDYLDVKKERNRIWIHMQTLDDAQKAYEWFDQFMK